MRQNLTNLSTVNIEDVDHFYIVGSTTKEGLIEGKSNVKLDLKKAASGGGGTSSEDAERLYEALFGQMPYVQVVSADQQISMLPLYEAFTTNPEILREARFFYKSSTPIPRAIGTEASGDEDHLEQCIYFALDENIGMVEMPTEATGLDTAWYRPVEYDVNLVGYTIPTKSNPTTVSGTLPEKSEIHALMVDVMVPFTEPTQVYQWDGEKKRICVSRKCS